MSRDRLPDAVGSIPEVLAFWAARTPDAPAFIVPGRPPITYAALWRRARSLAASLNRAGIGRQDRVVLLVPDGSELAMTLLGTMAAAIAIPININLTATELDAALDGLEAAAAVVVPPLPEVARACLARHGVPLCELGAGAGAEMHPLACAAARPPRRAARPRPEDVALVLLTSGTTERPKRVPATHGWLVRDGRARRDLFGLHRHDRALMVAPLTLSLGTCVLFHSIVAGAALIFPPASDLPTLLATIDEQRPTWMFPSARLVDMLVTHLRTQPARPQPSSLRFVRVTAAPISPAVCAELARRLGAPVLDSYSSTEMGLIATALPPPAPHKPGSVGKPFLELRVVETDGSDADPGVEGEIWVWGAKLARGYLDDPETNAAVLTSDGWFRTGDVGYLDDDGFLFLTGRLSERINRGGEKIAPAEVDAALLAHPAVSAAAAFAVPDARLGEDIVAAVELRDGQRVSARDLRAWMLARLSPPKVPRRIWFVNDLPRTALGKVQRAELRQQWLEQHDPAPDCVASAADHGTLGA
jgi:acyl-CoA synthetase (AMP-forming)/AMP-acid ligase II